jgi:hypothetical protein
VGDGDQGGGGLGGGHAKEYFDRSPLVSKTSDNEHATASLGDSEELSVQNPVGEPIPEVGQVLEDLPEVLAAGDGKEARDVFAKEPAGTELIQQSHDM